MYRKLSNASVLDGKKGCQNRAHSGMFVEVFLDEMLSLPPLAPLQHIWFPYILRETLDKMQDSSAKGLELSGSLEKKSMKDFDNTRGICRPGTSHYTNICTKCPTKPVTARQN